MALTLEQTDGQMASFVLEMSDQLACRRCGWVDRGSVERGPSMWRLRRTGYPLPPRADAPWWLRARLPWNPWGPMRGFYASAIAPLAFAGLFALLPFSRFIDPPTWLTMSLTIAMVTDIILSTFLGYLRELLEASGARFDRPHPFGQRPGNAILWSIHPAMGIPPSADRRRAMPPALPNPNQKPNSPNTDQSDAE